MRIYISRPVTGTDDYIYRFSKAEKILEESGYSVVNPVKVNAQLPEDTTYRQYMEVSLAMLGTCDAVYMMDGWKESKGAKLEYAYAVTLLGLKVYKERI